mgnify:CR=1 FL=1
MYKRKVRGWSQHIDFILLDILCSFLSLFLGFLLSGQTGMWLSRSFWGMALEVMLVNLVVIIVLDTYHSVLHHSPWDEMVRLLAQTGYAVLILLILRLLNPAVGADLSTIALYAIPIYVLFCYIMRQAYKSFLKKKHHILNRHSLLIALEASQIPTVIPRILRSNYGAYRFSGLAIMGDNPSEEQARHELSLLREQYPEIETIPIIATSDTLEQYLTNNWVDEVYLDVPPKAVLPVDLINNLMRMGITIHTALTNLDELESRHKNVEWICGHLTITTSLGYITSRDVFLKRIMDICGGLVGSLIALFVIAIVGPQIKRESPGPVLFKQTRIGFNGQRFTLYKIRSMYMDAEERKKDLMDQNKVSDGMMFKMDWDPRIIGNKIVDGKQVTGIGEKIRSLSLDEFPQFFNVLKGDMSLVGTRPPTLDEWDKYKYHHRARLSIKPGITGMWQANGRSRITDFEEVVKLDTEYIENWSIGLDIKLLLKTVKAVVKKDGAM